MESLRTSLDAGFSIGGPRPLGGVWTLRDGCDADSDVGPDRFRRCGCREDEAWETGMERKLVVCEGPSRGAELVLAEGKTVTLGRGLKADMRVDDPAVSRIHAEVGPKGEGWVVRDRGSRNHVFVNKKAVEAHALRDGDVFRLGKNTAILFRQHDTTREVPTREPEASLDSTLAVKRPQGLAPRAPKAAPSLVGQTLGEFRVAEKVSESGHAICYRALQPSLNRNVLLQVYPPAVSKDDTFRERILAEVRAVSPLLHPNILQLFDLEEEGGWLFLVMEYFKGTPLAEYLERKSFLPIRGAIDLTMQLCDALVYAGEQQWVVTEVPAANVLIDDKFTGKLRLFKEPSDPSKPSPDLVDLAGLAPEVLSPTRKADVRSAVYALGAMLFRCVGGMPPFAAADPDSLKAKILKDPPRSLKKLNIRASDGLCEVVNRALEKNPDKRYQSPAELVVDLKKLISG